MPQVITVAQLAERWRLPRSTVERLAKEGQIPCLYVREEIFFLESAIKAWENRKERKTRDRARHQKAGE
jgi:excisionase family DNA binding protein